MPAIDQQITFLYTHDLGASAAFYEQVMGLPLWRDQGTCRIYHVTGQSYIGICQRDDALPQPSRRDIIFTIVTPQVDAWYDELKSRGAVVDKAPEVNPQYGIYHFFVRDPNGYLIEIQRFLD
jgi:catechol 2,3-dioxygenase-like lactoylglutathione lyase family enzyme